MLPMPSLTAAGRLGTTPSASSPNTDGGSTSAAVPSRWYDRECVPFARALAGMLETWPVIAPEYKVLQVRAAVHHPRPSQLICCIAGSRKHGRDVLTGH